MLFIQAINIYYYKNMRYPNYAQIRNSIKFRKICPEPCNFYSKEINSDNMLDCEVLFHNVNLWQDTKLKEIDEYFIKYNDEIFTEGKRDSLRNFHNLIYNIRLFRKDSRYKIMFCDDDFYFHPAKKHGHNEAYNDRESPFRYTDRIYETAFILNPDEYGRIIYNERYTKHYRGIWYYGLHTYNIINCDKSDFREKMFFRKNPDYEYKQLAKLYY